jgi:hypothetical protein
VPVNINDFMMELLRQPIQNKLSSLLGRAVTIEQLNFSLLGGSIDARGISIAGDDVAMPLLTLARLRAEIAIKSLTIERPVLWLVQKSDGTFALPFTHGPQRDPTDITETPDTTDVRQWRPELQKLLLIDGEVCFQSEFTALAGYQLVAQNLTAELTQSGGGFNFTAMANLHRHGERSADIGPLRLRGEIGGITDLSRFADASIEAKASLGELLHADISTASISSRSVSLAFIWQLDLGRLPDLLPLALSRRLRLSGAGTADIAGRARHDPRHGLQIDEFTLRLTGIAL